MCHGILRKRALKDPLQSKLCHVIVLDSASVAAQPNSQRDFQIAHLQPHVSPCDADFSAEVAPLSVPASRTGITASVLPVLSVLLSLQLVLVLVFAPLNVLLSRTFAATILLVFLNLAIVKPLSVCVSNSCCAFLLLLS